MHFFVDKSITINNCVYSFDFDIRKVLEYQNYYIVLLSIPFDSNCINNLYCLDDKANVIWQAEDLNKLFPKFTNLPYEQMGIKNDKLFASDFYGKNYMINLLNGAVEGYTIVK